MVNSSACDTFFVNICKSQRSRVTFSPVSLVSRLFLLFSSRRLSVTGTPFLSAGADDNDNYNYFIRFALCLNFIILLQMLFFVFKRHQYKKLPTPTTRLYTAVSSDVGVECSQKSSSEFISISASRQRVCISPNGDNCGAVAIFARNVAKIDKRQRLRAKL